MLSMVDENDLAEFVPEKKPQTETPSVIIPETEKKPEAEKPEEKADKAENQTGALLAIGLLAAGGAGAYYYFKVCKTEKGQKQMPKMKIWNFITVRISMKIQRTQKKQKNRTKQGQLMKGLSFLKRRGTICF
mgnify:CR=1 FL=1